mgnify:CR=1 FL=1
MISIIRYLWVIYCSIFQAQLDGDDGTGKSFMETGNDSIVVCSLAIKFQYSGSNCAPDDDTGSVASTYFCLVLLLLSVLPLLLVLILLSGFVYSPGS